MTELKKARKVLKKLSADILILEADIARIKEADKYAITEQVFYNKELSDAIRDVVVLSPCTFEQASHLFAVSKDFNRDKEHIKKLLCNGVSYTWVLRFIICINS